MTVCERLHMPPLDGAAGWLKLRAARPVGLRGSVILALGVIG
jgi:hypothetical protein